MYRPLLFAVVLVAACSNDELPREQGTRVDVNTVKVGDCAEAHSEDRLGRTILVVPCEFPFGEDVEQVIGFADASTPMSERENNQYLSADLRDCEAANIDDDATLRDGWFLAGRTDGQVVCVGRTADSLPDR